MPFANDDVVPATNVPAFDRSPTRPLATPRPISFTRSLKKSPTSGAEPPPLSRALRRLHRALPDAVVGADGEPVGRGHVPLRAWYPFEVLTLPFDEGGEPLGDEDVERGLITGSLARDTRLADALAAIRAGGVPALRVPDIVEEAAYAVECAAVGEVDTTRLVAHLDELEARLAQLEQGFRARVIRRLSRLAGGVRRDGH